MGEADDGPSSPLHHECWPRPAGRSEPTDGPNALERRTGYVVDQLWPQQASTLSAHLLARLSAELKAQGAYLVITVDPSAGLRGDILDEYVVDWDTVPDPATMLLRHAAWYGMSHDELWSLEQSDRLHKVVRRHLLPYEVEQLAQELPDIVRGGLPIDVAVARLDSMAIQWAATWFETHPDLRDWSFIIALSVLDGTTYPVVADAGDRLWSLLEPERSPQDRYRDVRSSRARRVREAWAHLVQGSQTAAVGSVPVERVSFDDPSLQAAVRDHIWQEYNLRRPLSECLLGLGKHANDEVRGRAAVAVAALSRLDFSDVFEAVLLPWAASDDERVRATAALGLGVVAFDDQLAPQVFSLLEQWCMVGPTSLLKRTAAMSYGFFGQRFPADALRGLGTLIRLDDPELLEAVGRSVQSIAEDSASYGNSRLILDTVESWAKDSDPRVASEATRLFVMLGDVWTEDTHRRWPIILHVADEHPDRADELAELLGGALDDPAVQAATLATIDRWLEAADDDERLLSTMQSVIEALARRSSSARERLALQLQRREQDPPRGSRSARRLLIGLQALEPEQAEHSRPPRTGKTLDPLQAPVEEPSGTSSDASRPVRVFFSYSHKDSRYRDELEAHLASLKRANLIDEWYDGVIDPGEDWRKAIEDNLERANVVLLLVSSDFVASDFCQDHEMARALDRHKAGETRVVPIILRDVDWHSLPIGGLEALPTDGRPVLRWRSRDQAWTDVATRLRRLVERMRESGQP